MRGAWLVWLAAACGRFGFDAPAHDAANEPDGPVVDATPPDAPTGPFGAVTVVPGLDGAGTEDDVSLTADQLEVFFDSSRTGGLGGGDLWTATRGSVLDPFATPTNVTVLNGTGDDATPDVSGDGLTLYYVTDRAGGPGAKDIYVATRPDRSAAWVGPVLVPELSTPGDEAGPTFAADGRVMMFGTDGAANDLYEAGRARPADAWGPVGPVAELNTAAEDAEPWINRDGTFLVFSSTRSGGAGGYDLWMARRASPEDVWDPPQPIAELNTAGNEADPWLSYDEHVIYFARDDVIVTASR
jgi:Tol biopolymer transport system component